MELTTTSVYEKILDAYHSRKRHIWVVGGTAASKSYSILQLLILKATCAKKPILISIVSESIPHIKRGCLRDFEKILGDAFDQNKFNRSDLIYTFPGGTKVEFFGADDASKLRGARRQILFLNEANNIPYMAFQELDARTERLTIADWNPTSEFWFYQNNLGDAPDSAVIHATYRDALAVIPPGVVENIQQMGARDPNWARIYLDGLLGKIEGLVFPEFEQVDELPQGDAFFGLDFGFTTDKTALVKCVIIGDRLYSQEMLYATNLTNSDIARKMEELGIRKRYDEIFADSAEPKSIEEIYRYGFNIKGCEKGPGSVEYGHQKIRQYKLFVTKGSLNMIKELRNFRYIPDKDGRLTEKTTHEFSHSLDALRYAVIGKTGAKPERKIYVYDAMSEVRDLL
ncbi:MAG: terminase large subunit [Methanofastidiosum sp.]